MADKKETTKIELMPLADGGEPVVDLREAISRDSRVANLLREANGARGGSRAKSEDVQVTPLPQERVVEISDVTKAPGFDQRLAKFHLEVRGIDLTRETGPVIGASPSGPNAWIQLFMCAAPAPLTYKERNDWRLVQWEHDAAVPWYHTIFLGIMKAIGKFKEPDSEPPEIEKRDPLVNQLIESLKSRGFNVQYNPKELVGLQHERRSAPPRGLWVRQDPCGVVADFWDPAKKLWAIGTTLEEELFLILYEDWCREQEEEQRVAELAVRLEEGRLQISARSEDSPLVVTASPSSTVVCSSTQDAREKMAAIDRFGGEDSRNIRIRFIVPESSSFSSRYCIRHVSVV